MKLLIIGAGGVGTSVSQIIKRAGDGGIWAEKIVLADYNLARAEAVVSLLDSGSADALGKRFIAEKIDARDPESIKTVIAKHEISFVMNAVEPAFNEIIFDTCYAAGVGYLDCAMTLSVRDAQDPYNKTNIKLGDYQFARHELWAQKGITALVGSGVEPGMADVFVRYAADHLFDAIDEVNIRDGDNYEGGGDFGFSVWTTIEECLNPPVIWEKDRGWFTTERFSEPEIFSFPGGIGDVEVVNVEHEEVLLVPRVIDCNRVTFKYGVPASFRQLLLNLESVGMAEAGKKIKVGDTEISPRDFLVKVVPSPTETSEHMTGRGSAGAWITGIKDGKRRSVYLYQVADNQTCIQKYGTNSVVAQTAVGPVIMLELIEKGIWNCKGVYGPESFPPDPFVERLAKYEFPAGLREMDSEYAEAQREKALLQPLNQK
ncbi:MAG: saccharopine dehydrogenase NADP-binding domain-containing protein [Clostridiales Family XIII bacterium]|jgi:saccharopine dehydrogenase-like NADP-dependent oxidoreductase|nr:saccharopine dehydrogenase NADP-binding domain-containing protein [Clostridiales Family XIII bacterium]